MKQKLSVLIVGLLLALIGCMSRSPQLFFGDGKCPLPCWYGLTPNKTTLSVAIGTLKSLPMIDGQSVEARTLTIINPPKVVASWNFTGDILGYGTLAFDANNKLEHTSIVPQGLYLGQIIDTWGNPISVLAVYHREVSGLYYFLWMFYPDRGIGVQAISHPISNESSTGNEDISRDMDVTNIFLYDPSMGIEYYFSQRVTPSPTDAQTYLQRLLPWPGFGNRVIHVEK